MAFIPDIRGVSEAALGQLSERFGDLPRPLLAAIGAGDFAVERLAELREALTASLEKKAGSGDARDFAAELPAKMQVAAAEVLESVQKFAFEVPAKSQHLVEQLPERVADMREALSPEQLKGAVDGYTQLAGVIYGSLADRGDKKWSSVLATAGHDTKVVDTPADILAPDPKVAAARAAEPKPVVRPTATTSATRKAATGAAAGKPARATTAKRAAAKPAPTAKPAPRRGSAGTSGTDTPSQR